MTSDLRTSHEKCSHLQVMNDLVRITQLMGFEGLILISKEDLRP